MAVCGTKRFGGCGNCRKRLGAGIRNNLLLVLLIIGAAVGLLIGVLVNPPVNRISDPEKKATTVMLMAFPGELLMNMLRMLVLPLVMASLITAVSGLNPAEAGKIGRRTLIYYLSTMVLAALLGLVLVVTIQPGKRDKPGEQGASDNKVEYRNLDSILDMLRNCFPSNLVEAAVRQRKTKYVSAPAEYDVYNVISSNKTLASNEHITATFRNGTTNISMVTKEIYPGSNTIPAGMKSDEGMNLLGLTVFAIVFGAVIGKMGEKGKPLVAFFSALNDAVLMLVTVIMWYSPIGVCSMIAARVAEMEDVWLSMQKLGMFIATVSIGLVIHTLVILPIVYFTVTRKNPYVFIKGLRDALMTAFGIASSAATLPTTIRCVEENNGVDSRISRFMLPLGATVNMDGSALNRPVVIIFVAQLNDIDLSPGKIVTITLMSVLIAVGAAGIPGSAMTTTIVLQSVGLPLHDLGLILAVDWLLDRFITVVNVVGDAMGTGIVEHLSRDELNKPQEKNNNPRDTQFTEKFLDNDEPDARLMTTGV
ncbi:hypothetical protein ACROYT_G028153 [Oculina patagonica]